MNRRPAFTLIEMLVVITILSVVLMLSAATLITLFRVERQFAADTSHDLSLSRLASHFRSDAHGATSASGEGSCELTLPDGRIVRYAFASPAIVREVRRGDQIEHRDAFVLSRHATAGFSLDASAQRPTVLLKVMPISDSEQPQAKRLRPLTIAAAVNLHGFSALGEKSP